MRCSRLFFDGVRPTATASSAALADLAGRADSAGSAVAAAVALSLGTMVASVAGAELHAIAGEGGGDNGVDTAGGDNGVDGVGDLVVVSVARFTIAENERSLGDALANGTAAPVAVGLVQQTTDVSTTDGASSAVCVAIFVVVSSLAFFLILTWSSADENRSRGKREKGGEREEANVLPSEHTRAINIPHKSRLNKGGQLFLLLLYGCVIERYRTMMIRMGRTTTSTSNGIRSARSTDINAVLD